MEGIKSFTVALSPAVIGHRVRGLLLGLVRDVGSAGIPSFMELHISQWPNGSSRQFHVTLFIILLVYLLLHLFTLGSGCH